MVQAIKELRKTVGCSLLFATIWVGHHDGPVTQHEESMPCPYRGGALRSQSAKQCRHCHRDWHDPNHIKFLGLDPPAL